MKKSKIRTEKLESDLQSRLNKISGQIQGIKRMIENNAYCDDVLMQVASVKSALDGVNKLVLKNHLNTCLIEDIKNEDYNVIDELMITVGRLMK